MKKILKIILIIVLTLTVLLITGLFFINETIEKKIIFKPSKEIKSLLSDFDKKAELENFITKDGLKLSYLHIKGIKKNPKILFCHGNDANITFEKIQKKLIFLVKNDYEIFSVDYRGYGKSEGSPDEKGVYSDVRAFINYLEQKLDIKSEDIVIWGHSLGAAIAIDTAASIKFKGVIVEGGFTSIEDMRNFRVTKDDKRNPISNFLRDFVYNSMEVTQKFNSKEKINLIKSPTFILHSKKDTVIPYEMSVGLSRLKPDAKIFISENGGHSEVGWQNNKILEFIKNLYSDKRVRKKSNFEKN